MYYVMPNFKTKKALKEAIKNGEIVTVFSPDLRPDSADSGRVAVGGPHYPVPHSWYAEAEVVAGLVTKIK